MTLLNARALRKNATECERLLWSRMRAHHLQDFKFKRQQPLGPYIVDFVASKSAALSRRTTGSIANRRNTTRNEITG